MIAKSIPYIILIIVLIGAELVISFPWRIDESMVIGKWDLDYELTYNVSPSKGARSAYLIFRPDKTFVGSDLPIEMTYHNYYTTPAPSVIEGVNGNWGIYSDGGREFVLLQKTQPGPTVPSRMTRKRLDGKELLVFSSREDKNYYFQRADN